MTCPGQTSCLALVPQPKILPWKPPSSLAHLSTCDQGWEGTTGIQHHRPVIWMLPISGKQCGHSFLFPPGKETTPALLAAQVPLKGISRSVMSDSLKPYGL